MNGSLPALPHPTVPAPDAAGHASEESGGGLVGYLILFLPYGVASALASLPLASYLVAWAGSVLILWLTLSGRVRPMPGGRSAFDQVMRPIVLTQVLFAGYSFLSSVFYVADINGFYYLSRVTTSVVPGAMDVAAQAQRYYVLAHAAVATGMLVAMDYRRSGEWAVRPLQNPALTTLRISLVCVVISGLLGGSSQIGIRIGQIGLVASVLSLGLAIPTRRPGVLLLGLGIYGLNMMSAFLSGWKEEVLVMVLLLAVFVYPYARRTVLIGAPVVLTLLLAFLPTYVDIIRGLSWEGTTASDEAASIAVDEITSGDLDMSAKNWHFLTGRISEIGMFVVYITAVEATNPSDPNGGYYGTQILRQAVMGLIPRPFWEDKPVTEEIVMERAYAANVVSEHSEVSAKPQYVVDGYLSWGAPGVFLSGLAFGLIAAWSSRACERWFGGYFWGSGLVYTAMFAVLWKGNSFEFFFNTVLWSFVLLVPLFWIGRMRGLLIHSERLEDVQELAEVTPHVASRRRHWAVT